MVIEGFTHILIFHKYKKYGMNLWHEFFLSY